MSTFKITHILTPEDARKHIVERNINSIVSELEIIKMNQADVLDKVNRLLSKPELVNVMSEDQKLYLLAATEHYMKEIDYADELIKKI